MAERQVWSFRRRTATLRRINGSVTGDDGSSMAAGFMQWENAFSRGP